MKRRCTAEILNPKTGVRSTCNNAAIVQVTSETGSQEAYCLGHKKLYDEFLIQAQHDAARWRNVPQFASADA